MEYQNYWRAFERTGSVKDYLHYITCARDELAAGITEDEDGRGGGFAGAEADEFGLAGEESAASPERAAMQAMLRTTMMGVEAPVIPGTAMVSGMPMAISMGASTTATLGYDDVLDARRRREDDPNP